MDFSNIIQNLSYTNQIWAFITPLIFMLADIISGFTQAIINKTIDSQKMREGLLRKFLLIIILVLSFIGQYAFNIPYISKAVTIYLVVMETVSILENIQKAGIDLKIFGELFKIKKDE